MSDRLFHMLFLCTGKLASLDRLALQRRLDDIGRQGGPGGA